MSETPEQSIVEADDDSKPLADNAVFTELVAEMVADQVPRVFAVVLEYGERVDAQIVAWGITLDDCAYMVTTDGKNQYSLAAPENALKYVRGCAGTTPHLVWAAGSSASASAE